MRKNLLWIVAIMAALVLPMVVCQDAGASDLMIDDDGNLVHFPPRHNRTGEPWADSGNPWDDDMYDLGNPWNDDDYYPIFLGVWF
jgi:hypothetical protein